MRVFIKGLNSCLMRKRNLCRYRGFLVANFNRGRWRLKRFGLVLLAAALCFSKSMVLRRKDRLEKAKKYSGSNRKVLFSQRWLFNLSGFLT